MHGQWICYIRVSTLAQTLGCQLEGVTVTPWWFTA
jgi:hypothetical protein